MSQDNNAFFADGLSIVHKGSKGIVTAIQAYNLKGVIVPATNISTVEDAIHTSTKVFFNGYPALNINAIISKSTGDEHTEGGILNGGLKGQSTRFIQGSTNLLIEGHEAVRHTDLTEPNAGNGPLVPIQQPSSYSTSEAEQLKKQKISERNEGQYYAFRTVGIKEGGIHDFIDLTTAQGEWIQRKCLKKSDESYFMFRHVPFCLQHRHWLLIPDFFASYPEELYNDISALHQNWENYYPIPLFTAKGESEKNYEEAALVKPLPFELTAFYPVATINQHGVDKIVLLPEGWLYLFLENKIWREMKVIRYARDSVLYGFQDVNLLLEKNRHCRRATVKTRLEVLLIPTRIKGKEVNIHAHFSKQQLTWNNMQAFSDPEAVKKTVLTEIENQWSEPKMPNYLDRWKKSCPNRPVLVVTITPQEQIQCTNH